MSNYTENIIKCQNMGEAVLIFRAALEEYSVRIQASRQKAIDIYQGMTPSQPYFEFAITSGISSDTGAWVTNRLTNELCCEMQKIIQTLQLTEGFDYVPFIAADVPINSGYIARLFGTEMVDLGENGLHITRHAIGSAADVDDLRMPDLKSDPFLREMCDRVKFLADVLEGCVDLVYPQLQGPASNSFRIIPQEEALMATLTEPEQMEKLGLLVTRAAVAILKTLVSAAGGSRFYRPRGRFYQPESVKGLFVDDWISIISPQSYQEIYQTSWTLMHQEIGPIFLHTCGPVDQCCGLLAALPGLVGLETAYVRNQSKTVADLWAVKAELQNQVTLGSFGGPFGKVVDDEDNFNRDVLRQLSQGGHFMIQAHGTQEYAQQLAADYFDR